jgi:hypothetical protein
MLNRNGTGSISAATEIKPEEASHHGRCKASSKPNPDLDPAIIHAELIGSDTAAAYGYAVQSSSPVLALARDLIDADHFDAPLDAYRGDICCLHIRSISEAATLAVSTHGVGFRKTRGAP